ncbi:MAG: hypothetical protein R2755_07415 [Acidimicrobiales bacterium]
MSIDQPAAPRALTAVEGVKASSRHLRGALAAELDDGTDHFGADSTHLVKFHGFYQQDDRDVRRERTARKLPPLYSCMVRAAVPGGVLSAEQWVVMDRLATEVAANAPGVPVRRRPTCASPLARASSTTSWPRAICAR